LKKTQTLTAQLNAALAFEARLHGLVDVLRAQLANGYGAAAEKITHMIKAAKSAAGVPRDTDAGQRLLDQLARDWRANL